MVVKKKKKQVDKIYIFYVIHVNYIKILPKNVFRHFCVIS